MKWQYRQTPTQEFPGHFGLLVESFSGPDYKFFSFQSATLLNFAILLSAAVI